MTIIRFARAKIWTCRSFRRHAIVSEEQKRRPVENNPDTETGALRAVG